MEGFLLLHRKLVLCAVDQHAQRIGAIRTDAGKRVNLAGAEFECRRAADRRVSGAGDIAVDGDIAAVCPQMAGIVDPAFDDQPAAPGRLQRAGVGDDIASRIDDERVLAVGDDHPLVDERHRCCRGQPRLTPLISSLTISCE